MQYSSYMVPPPHTHTYTRIYSYRYALNLCFPFLLNNLTKNHFFCVFTFLKIYYSFTFYLFSQILWVLTFILGSKKKLKLERFIRSWNRLKVFFLKIKKREYFLARRV